MSEESNIPAEEPQGTNPPSTDEPFNPITEPELQTTSLKPVVENMEVHKHPHHVTNKKKWGEYLLEFSMLFLAVFLGFIAENIREHYVEQQRAKQYASTMVQDLRADKEALEAGIATNTLIRLKIDTLLQMYHPGSTEKPAMGIFYYYGRNGFRFWHYVYKQVTLEQMKHSGTIRYFNNSSVENDLVALDKRISFIQYWEAREALFEERSLLYATRLFNYEVLQTVPVDSATLELAEYQNNKNQLTDGFTFDMPANPSFKNEPALIKEYLNFCFFRISVLNSKINVYRDALKEMEHLMETLKKEFDLK